MNIYNFLPNDIQNKIDEEVYLKKFKPIQDELITEINIFNYPKCNDCNLLLCYMDYEGNKVEYIRPHGLCIDCYNNESIEGSDTDESIDLEMYNHISEISDIILMSQY